MGDRCYVEVTLRKEDKDGFIAIFGDPEDEGDTGEFVVTLGFPEVNYGGGSELEEAREAGIQFYGWHSAGSSYDAAKFYTAEGTVAWIYQGMDNSGYILQGDTAQQRKKSYEVLEEQLAGLETLQLKMNSAIYALAKEGQKT